LQAEIKSLRVANAQLLKLNAEAAAACSQLQEVATRDEATIQELQGLLEEQQRQQAEAGTTMAAAEQQLQQISQRALQLGQDVAQRQALVDDLQVQPTHCNQFDFLISETLTRVIRMHSCNQTKPTKLSDRRAKTGQQRL